MARSGLGWLWRVGAHACAGGKSELWEKSWLHPLLGMGCGSLASSLPSPLTGKIGSSWFSEDASTTLSWNQLKHVFFYTSKSDCHPIAINAKGPFTPCTCENVFILGKMCAAHCCPQTVWLPMCFCYETLAFISKVKKITQVFEIQVHLRPSI